MQTYQTLEEMREDWIRNHIGFHRCGYEECTCVFDANEVADWWLHKIQAREEWWKDRMGMIIAETDWENAPGQGVDKLVALINTKTYEKEI